ncbi:MAG: DUF4153 domain-containing protein [Firmicutes bacterium]|nr:DUF4153 domain-containing protein [Bacillota bacterium]
MIKKFIRVVKSVMKRLLQSLQRFPEPLALACIVVTILIINNHAEQLEERNIRLAMIFALGIPLTLCLRLFMERKRVSKTAIAIAYLLTAIFLLLYHHLLLPELHFVTLTRYFAYSTALYLLFMVIPYLGINEGFELYVIKLFTDFIITFFYSLVLYLGLAAIIGTINLLFSVGISSKLYFDLWLIVAGIFAPAYFLAAIPASGEMSKMEDYPKFLQILLLYIVMPLLTAYTAILYLYFLKIIVTRVWPAIMVSHLVLWYSLLSTVVIFFISPLKEENAWVGVFMKYFPKLILPILIMMFAAMGIRINAYGITEKRYLVLAGGLWTSGAMLYYALRRKAVNIRIMIAAALIACLVVSGPWSAYAVSIYSQNKQMKKLLTKNNMLEEGQIVPAKTISLQDKKGICSIISYFNSYHDLSDLEVLPPDFTLDKMTEIFGFDLTCAESVNKFFSHRVEERQILLNVQNYDYLLSSNVGLYDGMSFRQDSLRISYQEQTLQITRDGKNILELDVARIALQIHEANSGEDILPSEKMTFTDENEHLTIKLIFHSIDGTEDLATGNAQISWIDFSALLKVY